MEIVYKANIEHCYQCPFKSYYVEHGFSGYICKKAEKFLVVPDKGINEKCPFKSPQLLG